MHKGVLITIVSAFVIMIILGVIIVNNMGDEDAAPAIKIEVINTNALPSTPTFDSDGQNSGSSGTAATENVIEMSSSGFSPSTLNKNVGETVTFTNVDGSTSLWPATDIHPTHKIYPGSDIDKCGTAEENLIFDSCGPVASGESYSFTFDDAGTWKYHDHRRASRIGTIIVS